MIRWKLVAHVVFWATFAVFVHERYFVEWVTLGSRLHGLDVFPIGALFAYVVWTWKDFVEVGRWVKVKLTRRVSYKDG